jgi:glycosyltransferase involved in cell wall biosynthesis
LTLQDPRFKSLVEVDFVGDVHPQFRAFVNNSPAIASFTRFTAPVPHKDLIALYGSSSVLLIILTGYKDAEGYMPGKLFEYIATGLPIIGTGPSHGDAAVLLKEVGTGEIIDDSQKERIKKKVLHYFQNWFEGNTVNSKQAGSRYSRKQITKTLSELL